VYTLDDAEARNREAPDSFLIPSRAARENLLPGEIVKLLFRIPSPNSVDVERMWVRIDERTGGAYVGTLTNDPRTTQEFGVGARVNFGPQHIIAIHGKPHEA
jgi:hypothetical protein